MFIYFQSFHQENNSIFNNNFSDRYNFNDEVITKLKKKQQLGCTDEETVDLKSQAASSSPPEDSSGASVIETTLTSRTFSTANAYLLVYYRSDFLKQTPSENVVAKLSNQTNIVNGDNIILEAWFTRLSQTQFELNVTQFNERELINTIYYKLWVISCANNNSKESTQNITKSKQNVRQAKPNGVEVKVLDNPPKTTAKILRETNIPAVSFYGTSSIISIINVLIFNVLVK